MPVVPELENQQLAAFNGLDLLWNFTLWQAVGVPWPVTPHIPELPKGLCSATPPELDQHCYLELGLSFGMEL